jgi:hypothetical protein
MLNDKEVFSPEYDTEHTEAQSTSVAPEPPPTPGAGNLLTGRILESPSIDPGYDLAKPRRVIIKIEVSRSANRGDKQEPDMPG